MPDAVCAQDFCRSWLHARDRDPLVANPCGRNAFTKAEKSQASVQEAAGLTWRQKREIGLTRTKGADEGRGPGAGLARSTDCRLLPRAPG